MEPNFEQPPQLPSRPQLPKHVKWLYIAGGVLTFAAGVIFVVAAVRYMSFTSGVMKDLGGK